MFVISQKYPRSGGDSSRGGCCDPKETMVLGSNYTFWYHGLNLYDIFETMQDDFVLQKGKNCMLEISPKVPVWYLTYIYEQQM